MMLQTLIGAWIGGTMLVFGADGSFYAGGASLLDRPLHGGRFVIGDGEILLDINRLEGLRPPAQNLVPHGSFRCAYGLRNDALRLSGCPYAGSYRRSRPRR
jgi:hypothetical protein